MKSKPNHPQHRLALPALFLVAMIWGGGFVAGKMALSGFSPFMILTWRFLISALLCGGIFFRKIRKTPRRTIFSGCAIGCIQLLALALQLIGLNHTTPAKQSFLCTAYVAMVPFLSWAILRKKPQLRSVFAGFLALCGIGLICLNGALSVSGGDLLSLGFSLVFGVQIVLVGKFVRKDTDAIQLSFFQFLTAGLLALVICLLRRESFFTQNGEALLGMAYLAVLNTLLAFLLQNAAQKYVNGSLTALILSLESVFGFLFSVLYYHEPLTRQLIVGSILCFGAILLNSLGKPRQRKCIRPASAADLDAVENSYTELLLHEQRTGISNTNWILNVYPCRTTAEKALAANTLYVMEENHTICASMVLNQNQADVYSEIDWAYPAEPEKVLVLHTLCIPPAHAGKGYGTAMVIYAQKKAKEMGCTVLRLDTFAGNKPAAALYKKLGFRYAGIRPTLHEGVIPEELIFFEKLL